MLRSSSVNEESENSYCKLGKDEFQTEKKSLPQHSRFDSRANDRYVHLQFNDNEWLKIDINK